MLTIPKEIKHEVATIIQEALERHEQFLSLEVSRVTQDGSNVFMFLKDKSASGTFMLNISVREVR